MVSLVMRMRGRVGVMMRTGTRMLLVGHAQEVHLAEERLAEDKDPHDVLRCMRVGEVTAVHLLLIEIMHLPLIGEAKWLDWRTSTAGREVVTMDVTPCAHVLRRVAHTAGAKCAGIGAWEVRLEYTGIKIPDVLASLACVVPHARTVEDVHELLRRAPVESERAVPRQLGGHSGWIMALALALALILTIDLALALALTLTLAPTLTLTLALALAWVGVRVRMRRRWRLCHGRLAVRIRRPGIGGWGRPRS